MSWGRINRGLSWYERIGTVFASTLVVVAVVVWLSKLGHHHSVRLSILIVALALAAAVAAAAFVVGRLSAPSRAPSSSREAELEQRVAEAEYAKRLLRDALESIQLGIAREDDWELDQLVERGVLGPVRGLLIRDAGEDVRMAVLVPRDAPPTRWRMRWAAGHRPESVPNYNREIDATMAGLAFRRGEVVKSDNVRTDDRFQAHPRESRPFASLVAVPLQVGETIVGALSVVSTREGAFAEPDLSLISLVGAVIDVLLADEVDVQRIHREARAAAVAAVPAAAAPAPAAPPQELPEGG